MGTARQEIPSEATIATFQDAVWEQLKTIEGVWSRERAADLIVAAFLAACEDVKRDMDALHRSDEESQANYPERE